jgi:ABC-type Fe3+ transport system substrate-binding protein
MRGRRHFLFGFLLILGGLVLGGLLLPPVRTPAWAGSAAGPRWGTDVMPSVPKEEVAAAIRKEGSKLVVSGFASGEVRSHYHPLWFQEWVREIYGVPIQVQFVPAEGDQIIEQLKAVKKGEAPAIDLMATENMFVNSAIKQDLVEPNVLDSPLIPLAKKVPKALHMANTALRIQGAEGIFMVYNPKYFKKEDADQIKTWLDVAKVYPKYKGKILWWHPVGDPAGLAQIISITMDRGAEYKDNKEIEKTIQWIKQNVDPYILRYVRGYGDFTVLVEKEEAYQTVMWYGTSKKYILGGLVKPMWVSNIMSMPGYMAMAKGSAHPTLAKLYMNFQMSHYIQMPPYPAKAPYEMFQIDQANWLRGNFGGVGIPGDYAKYMPDWAKAIVPPAEEVNKRLVDVDWDYVFAHKGEWQEMWGRIIGE